MPKLIKLHILNTCSLLYVNYILIKLKKKICYSFQSRWIGFTLLIQAIKKLSKIHKTMVIRHRTVQKSNPQERGRKSSVSGTPAHCLERVSRPQHRDRKPKQSLSLSEMRRQSLELREAKGLELKGESTGEERASQSELQRCAQDSSMLRLSSALRMHVRKGKNLLEQSRQTIPPAGVEKPPNHGSSSKVFGRGLCQEWAG